MQNILTLLSIVGLLLMWLLITALLVPCAIAAWALKQCVRALSWLRERAV